MGALVGASRPLPQGEEHGSARWATQKEMEAFSDRKDADNNILLTEHAKIRLIDKSHDQRTETNNNVLVIGGPGTGKTRYFVKPNLMQLNANYFITDPKGTLIHDMGWVLEDAGYEIRTFDTINFDRSLHFNPIEYIKGEADTLRFVECLIRNTTGDDQHSGDPFWRTPRSSSTPRSSRTFCSTAPRRTIASQGCSRFCRSPTRARTTRTT